MFFLLFRHVQIARVQLFQFSANVPYAYLPVRQTAHDGVTVSRVEFDATHLFGTLQSQLKTQITTIFFTIRKNANLKLYFVIGGSLYNRSVVRNLGVAINLTPNETWMDKPCLRFNHEFFIKSFSVKIMSNVIIILFIINL